MRRIKPSPREQPYPQPTVNASKPIKYERGPKYHNPDPLAQLIGPNEAWVEVNCVATYAVIDTSAQITTITYSFVTQLQLEVQDLNQVICLEGTEGLQSHTQDRG